MKAKVNKKKIIKELKTMLMEKFTGYIDKVVLFGSQTGNTANKYSDYDILIVLEKDYTWQLEDMILSLCYEIDLKYDIVTDVKLISRNELKSYKGKQPYIMDALEFGLAV